MELHDDPPFSDTLELLHGPRPELATELLGATFTDAAHAEDALLAEFARWLAARAASAAQRRAGIELLRDALDFVGDPAGPWQALPIERWLAGAGRRSCTWLETKALAGELLRFLVDRGRLSLHGQRVLARRIAATHARVGASDPQLAA